MKKSLLACCLFILGGAAYSQTYTVTTVTGQAGTSWLNVDGTLADAQWRNPQRLIIDTEGNLIVAAKNQHSIRKIDLANGVVTTIAGGLDADASGRADAGFADGPVATAQFDAPAGVAMDAAGNIYVADKNNHLIRKISGGNVTTLAGTVVAGAGVSGSADNADPLQAQFTDPVDIIINSTGDLFVADGNGIRKITKISTGVYGAVTTLPLTDGSNPFGFTTIQELALDLDGDLLVVDSHRLTEINLSTNIATVLIGGLGTANRDHIDGTFAAARFYSPYGLGIDKATGNLYIAEVRGYIRKIDRAAGMVSTIAGAAGTQAMADGDGSVATFYSPQGVEVDADGNLYIVDTNGGGIRKITITDALPVKLTSFTAKKQHNAIRLDWATASEINNSHFDLLRSSDGSDVNVIATVPGNGNSSSKKTYSYTDYSPLPGDNYYQLRQVDFDGKSELSKIQVVQAELQQAGLKVYASSDSRELKVFVYSAKGGKASLQISDLKGNSVLAQDIVLEKGYSTLNLPASLQQGVYVAALKTGTENLSAKFITQ